MICNFPNWKYSVCWSFMWTLGLNHRSREESRELLPPRAWRQFPALVFTPVVEPKVLSRNTGLCFEIRYSVLPKSSVWKCKDDLSHTPIRFSLCRSLQLLIPDPALGDVCVPADGGSLHWEWNDAVVNCNMGTCWHFRVNDGKIPWFSSLRLRFCLYVRENEGKIFWKETGYAYQRQNSAPEF